MILSDGGGAWLFAAGAGVDVPVGGETGAWFSVLLLGGDETFGRGSDSTTLAIFSLIFSLRCFLLKLLLLLVVSIFSFWDDC